MALPALRQPKFTQNSGENEKKLYTSDTKYVILTLRNDCKLVIDSDYYNGIINEEDMYKCVFCGMLIDLDSCYKELHKNSSKHMAIMMKVPYVEEFPESLVRKLNKEMGYCTICNVTVYSFNIARHISTEAHDHQFQKATTRALSYTPHT